MKNDVLIQMYDVCGVLLCVFLVNRTLATSVTKGYLASIPLWPFPLVGQTSIEWHIWRSIIEVVGFITT